MTNAEIARFALQLREAKRIRAQIAEDEAAARTAGGGSLPTLVAPPAVQPSVPSAVAAA
jgi:hypothetical protein